ncbi:response regulator [Salinirubellus salinus]|uniref:Response regulator n=1 Tax=Salinirubellus salinus TaxID=1364945 RepID=A0A9E7U904_9EURY|nr:response regulator [Salinirubellus salinus]UWM52788.1 response regulator [Salinirubellus salinus]
MLDEPPSHSFGAKERGVHVLHVDDEAMVRDLVRIYLERHGADCAVRSVTSAAEALELLEQEQFDCIVSDYRMPDMDGIEFLERVRETNPEVPFILFTGQGSEEVASRAIERGVTDYLQKGEAERLELLWNRIDHAVEHYRRRRELSGEARKFRAVFDRSSDAMLLADEVGRYVDVNDAACDLFGVPREELLGRTAIDFAPPEFDFETAWRQFRSSDGEEGEFPLVRPDGETIMLEYSAVPDVVPGLNLSVLRPVESEDDSDEDAEDAGAA